MVDAHHGRAHGRRASHAPARVHRAAGRGARELDQRGIGDRAVVEERSAAAEVHRRAGDAAIACARAVEPEALHRGGRGLRVDAVVGREEVRDRGRRVEVVHQRAGADVARGAVLEEDARFRVALVAPGALVAHHVVLARCRGLGHGHRELARRRGDEVRDRGHREVQVRGRLAARQLDLDHERVTFDRGRPIGERRLGELAGPDDAAHVLLDLLGARFVHVTGTRRVETHERARGHRLHAKARAQRCGAGRGNAEATDRGARVERAPRNRGDRVDSIGKLGHGAREAHLERDSRARGGRGFLERVRGRRERHAVDAGRICARDPGGDLDCRIGLVLGLGPDHRAARGRFSVRGCRAGEDCARDRRNGDARRDCRLHSDSLDAGG